MSNPQSAPGSSDVGTGNQDPAGQPTGGGGWPQPQEMPAGHMPAQGGWGQQAPAPAWGQSAPIWPPPATNQTYQPTFYPFRFLYMKVAGNVADFREGQIGIAPDGLTIVGKAQPRAEIYQAVQVVTFLLSVFICIIASLIMRYAFLQPSQLRMSWQQVRQIVLQPAKRRACIVYDAPNYANTIKTFSLAFQLPPLEYEAFTKMAQQYAPAVTGSGRIKSAQSIVIAFFAFLLILVGAVVLISLLDHK